MRTESKRSRRTRVTLSTRCSRQTSYLILARSFLSNAAPANLNDYHVEQFYEPLDRSPVIYEIQVLLNNRDKDTSKRYSSGNIVVQRHPLPLTVVSILPFVGHALGGQAYRARPIKKRGEISLRRTALPFFLFLLSSMTTDCTISLFPTLLH